MREFRPGFRFSLVDLCVLVVGGLLSAVLGVVVPWPGLASVFVVANYFLFCNVLRMARPLELIWADYGLRLADWGDRREVA